MTDHVPLASEVLDVLAKYIPGDLPDEERKLRKVRVRLLYAAYGSTKPYWSAVPYTQKAACFKALQTLAGVVK